MKKLIFLAGLFLVLLSSKCEDDNGMNILTGDILLNFNGTYAGNPLLMYAADYPYEDDMAIRLQLFQFYISDIELLKEADVNAEGIEVLDVDLVSFKDVQSEDAAANGIDVGIAEVPPGTYRGIRFKLGVEPGLNSTTPGDYSTAHPLSNHYWSASLGYVFTKIEGNADVDGSGAFEEKLTYHIGTDAMLREVAFLQEIVITEGGIIDLNFEVDLKKVLVKDDGNFLDFRESPIDHTSNPEVASFISDNLVNAITLK